MLLIQIQIQIQRRRGMSASRRYGPIQEDSGVGSNDHYHPSVRTVLSERFDSTSARCRMQRINKLLLQGMQAGSHFLLTESNL